MSKVKESCWVELSITLYPDDIAEIKDILSEGRASGILEHIVALAEEKLERNNVTEGEVK